MECLFCNSSNVALNVEKKKRVFKKEEFEIFEYFYKCDKCKQEFTTTEIDTINVNQVHNLYREKYSIPSPEQLTSVREHYNLSSAKISALLGFGANQYRLYENGELPVGGNATVLSLILNPKAFKEIIRKNKDILTLKKYEEIISKADKKIADDLNGIIEHSLFPFYKTPNRYTGYTVPQFIKFANMVLFFLNNAPFKVRLNKLLFYADFRNYKYSGFSISGCKYAAIDMGSVPDNYSLIFGLMESEKYLTTELVKIKDKEHEKFVPLKSFDKSIFTEFELSTLGEVFNKFKNTSTPELMNISHEEKAWIDNIENKSVIDYSTYAPQLKAL